MSDYIFVKIIKILTVFLLFIMLIGTIVMLLWNWLMPTLFNLPNIDFLQAIGLTVLTRILAGGFRFGFAASSSEHWERKRQMWEKFTTMTPEEKQRWKEEWRNKCKSRQRMGFKRYDENIENDQI